jgi:cytoskeletal protein CcmA (bactofilin family)
MFQNKKTTNNTVNNINSESPTLNVISEGTKIEGTINSEKDIRIAGRVDGEAICNGKIIITNTAHIEGDLVSADADITGTVQGKLKISNKLTLRESAVIGGDIHAKILIVEEGAQINGNCNTGNSTEKNNAKTDFSKIGSGINSDNNKPKFKSGTDFSKTTKKEEEKD